MYLSGVLDIKADDKMVLTFFWRMITYHPVGDFYCFIKIMITA